MNKEKQTRISARMRMGTLARHGIPIIQQTGGVPRFAQPPWLNPHPQSFPVARSPVPKYRNASKHSDRDWPLPSQIATAPPLHDCQIPYPNPKNCSPPTSNRDEWPRRCARPRPKKYCRRLQGQQQQGLLSIYCCWVKRLGLRYDPLHHHDGLC